MLGHSLGGLISSFISADLSSKVVFDGICYVAPYFDVYDRTTLNKLEPMVEMMNKVTPNK